MESTYNLDLSNEQVYDTDLVLAKAYELDQASDMTMINLINSLEDSMEPQKVRDAVKVLYKCGFLCTPALLGELNDDTFFVIREIKKEEARKMYELFNVKELD